MQPTGSQVQAVDPVLSNMLVVYMQKQERFVADRVFPGVPVDKDSGTYYIFDKKYWLTDEAAVRAYGADFATAQFGVSSDTYTTIQYALEKPIADEDRANSQVPMELERAAVNWLGLKFLIRKEVLFAAAAMVSSVWDTDKTVSNKWSDTTNGDPVGDVKTGKRTISQSTGFHPNKMVVGELVDDRLQLHPDIVDRLKFVQRATEANVKAALADIFGVEQYIVAAAIYNSANEGQTASISAIIDDDCLLVYCNNAPSIFEPSGGYTYAWAPGGGLGQINRPYYTQKNKSTNVQGQLQVDHKVVATDLGYFMPDCTD